MSAPIISVRGVSKRYKLGSGRANRPPEPEFWALKDISFDIYPGEIIGVLGGNSSGKSTLLKILGRITEPTTGEITLHGQPANLLEIGAGFNPELSGRDNVFLSGAILGMSRPEVTAKFAEIVAFSEIESLIDTPVKHYSSSMYIRLAFAVVAHSPREILLLDEVLAVVDARFQRKCVERLLHLSRKYGRTILFVSHSVDAVRQLCRRCAVLKTGSLAGIFPTEEAIEQCRPLALLADLDLDTSSFPRTYETEGKIVRIVRVRVLSPGGLQFNEPLTLEFTLDISEPVPTAVMRFTMTTIEGQRIMTLGSDVGGERLFFRAGRSVVRLRVDQLPVSPGYYYCSTTVSGAVVVDTIDDFAQWEVQGGAQRPDSVRGIAGCVLSPAVELVGPDDF